MTVQQETLPSISQLGQEIYDRSLREKLEADHAGEYLLIHVDTEEYVMDEDQLVAAQQAIACYADGRWYMIRIGYPAATRIGWFPRSGG